MAASCCHLVCCRPMKEEFLLNTCRVFILETCRTYTCSLTVSQCPRPFISPTYYRRYRKRYRSGFSLGSMLSIYELSSAENAQILCHQKTTISKSPLEYQRIVTGIVKSHSGKTGNSKYPVDKSLQLSRRYFSPIKMQ